MKIEIIEDFREQKSPEIDVSRSEFFLYLEKQWSDFDYKIKNDETLNEVQKRNINALSDVLNRYKGRVIAIGTHGTALSTIINYFDNAYSHLKILI